TVRGRDFPRLIRGHPGGDTGYGLINNLLPGRAAIFIRDLLYSGGFERQPSQRLPKILTRADPERRPFDNGKRLLPCYGAVESRKTGSILPGDHLEFLAGHAANSLAQRGLEVVDELLLNAHLTPGQRFTIDVRRRR